MKRKDHAGTAPSDVDHGGGSARSLLYVASQEWPLPPPRAGLSWLAVILALGMLEIGCGSMPLSSSAVVDTTDAAETISRGLYAHVLVPNVDANGLEGVAWDRPCAQLALRRLPQLLVDPKVVVRDVLHGGNTQAVAILRVHALWDGPSDSAEFWVWSGQWDPVASAGPFRHRARLSRGGSPATFCWEGNPVSMDGAAPERAEGGPCALAGKGHFTAGVSFGVARTSLRRRDWALVIQVPIDPGDLAKVLVDSTSRLSYLLVDEGPFVPGGFGSVAARWEMGIPVSLAALRDAVRAYERSRQDGALAR